MTDRVTQADIAKKAGVHVTTVSMALRNHPSLPVATRQRIQDLAEQMGYKPDPVLGALMAYRKGRRPHEAEVTLGYITNWDTEWGWKMAPPHAGFFAGAAENAGQLGFHLEHFWLGEKGLSHRRMSDILISRGIAGLIIASFHPKFTGELEFDWPKFSAVKIDYLPHMPKLHNVSNDQRAIIQLAMQHIKAAGYQRIGCVMPRWWDQYVARAWSAGFLAEQDDNPEQQRIPILYYDEQDYPQYVPGNYVATTAVDKLAIWMERHRPEVILSSAPFVRPQLAALGLSVPKDVAYVDLYREDTDSDTAGIRQNCHRVGALAVELVAGQLQLNQFGLPQFQTASLVEGTWFDGASFPPRELTQPVFTKHHTGRK
jgi:LacI family transcriptional regulator